MAKFTVVLDACVLYPAPLRDLLMHLTVTDLFKAHWTDQIHEEWITALLRRDGFERSKLENVKQLMNAHARDALVTGYESLIESLTLPDEDDRHVLAAAIRCNADAIVTKNLKDFPADTLKALPIEAIHPDDFLFYQLELSTPLFCSAVKRMRQSLKNPPKTAEELLLILRKQELPQTCLALEKYRDFI